MAPYELNIHAGGFFPDLDDDTDAEFLLGARIMLQRPSGWGFGGSFDWIPRDEIDLPPGSEDEDIDISTYLYSAAVEYTTRTVSPVRVFFGGGIGAATTTLGDLPSGSNIDDSETDLLVPLYVGLKWFNRLNRPTWGIRIEGRDNIIWVEQLDGDDEAENNWELSGGISFFFGE